MHSVCYENKKLYYEGMGVMDGGVDSGIEVQARRGLSCTAVVCTLNIRYGQSKVILCHMIQRDFE